MLGDHLSVNVGVLLSGQQWQFLFFFITEVSSIANTTVNIDNQ